mmetsp:Transcript_35112/g.76682  ORF Transcript_35112/g.76682 Transcript_35112/m.76682 type:complete len:232 (-) Transcript_35112:419-1114(-)
MHQELSHEASCSTDLVAQVAANCNQSLAAAHAEGRGFAVYQLPCELSSAQAGAEESTANPELPKGLHNQRHSQHGDPALYTQPLLEALLQRGFAGLIDHCRKPFPLALLLLDESHLGIPSELPRLENLPVKIQAPLENCLCVRLDLMAAASLRRGGWPTKLPLQKLQMRILLLLLLLLLLLWNACVWYAPLYRSRTWPSTLWSARFRQAFDGRLRWPKAASRKALGQVGCG